MSDRLVELVGGYTIADNVPARGTVSVNPLIVAGNSAPEKRLVTKHTVVGTLDSEGRFSVEVLDSFDPDWNVGGGVPYEIREYIIGGRGRSYVVYITGPGPVDLLDLQPVETGIQTVAPYPVPGPAGPANSLAVGTVTTLPPDSPATASITGTPPSQVLDLGIPKGVTGNPTDAALGDLTDVDTSRDATGMVITRQVDGTYKGQNVRQTLNQLTDVTALPNTPPNSLLGTVGDGLTPGVAEWEGLHLDYIQEQVLGPLPSSVADLGQRVTELEHTGEVVPPDLELGVDLYGGSFTRIIGADAVTASPSKRIRLTLATAPGPNGAVFATLADISGTGAVWADFAGNIGKAVDTSGTGLNGASLKEAIRRGQIVTVHRGSDGTHPTLVVERVEDPADAGSSLTLDALKNVAAPASTPAGKFLGTTATDAWGPVDNPTAGLWPGKTRTSRPNVDDRLVEVWDGAKWVPIHYDSGWRMMSSWDAAGNVTGAPFGDGWAPRTGTAGGFRLRSMNGALHISIEQVQATAANPNTMFALPSGFGCRYLHRLATTPAAADIGIVNTVGIGRIGGGSVAVGSVMNISGSAPRGTDSIPTSLPGTLITPAP
jgi:hypothetical protein